MVIHDSMFIFFLKAVQQSLLFETPVMVEGSVRKDGTVVKPHVRIQKKKLPDSGSHAQASMFDDEPVKQAKPTKLEAFILKQGGLQSLASKLSILKEEQKQIIFEKMAALDGKTLIKEVAAMFEELRAEEVKRADLFAQPAEPESKPKAQESFVVPPRLDFPTIEHDGDTWYIINTGTKRDGKTYVHLSSATRGRPAKNGIHPVQMADWIELGKDESAQNLPIVEHVTKKGKTLRGVIRNDLTKEEAAEIDQYTFRKDGGWFIREKYLGDQITVKQEAAEIKNVSEEQPTLNQAPVADSVELDPLEFGVKAGISKGDRRKLNAAAAELVMNKSASDMTDEDRALLRQYSGNGGCGDSLNEFYTDPAVALSMWHVVEQLGISGGTVLEPSSGTGVFLHTAPKSFKVTGVEMEATSAKIAQALHGERHEIVNASLERFATQDTRQFDVVIGNPPYGPRGMLLKDDKKFLSKAEEYFIDTGLDKTRAGGLCMLVVPSGIMDSKNGRKFRERMLRKAEFLGAQRLPNSAFEASHTDVTADVIYLRKRPDDIAGALSTLDKKTLQSLGVWDDEFLSGGYFAGRGKDNVFGEVGTTMRAFGEIYTVNGSMRDVPDMIVKFNPHSVTKTPSMQDILSALPDESDKNRALNAADKKPYHDCAKVGDTKTEDGVTYVLQGDPPRWHRVDDAMQSDAVISAVALSAEIDKLMAGEAVDRVQLEEEIRAWVGTHGIPAKHSDVMIAAGQDKSLYRLIGAVGKDGRLSDLVAGREAKQLEGGFDAVAHTLALSHDTGDFTVAELAQALNKDEDAVLDQLFADARYAVVNDERWAPMDTYLTGHLWPKLDAVNAKLSVGGMDSVMRSKLQNQKARLEETIDPKTLEDVDIQLNSAFIPLNIMEAWIDSRADALREQYPESSWYRDMSPASVTFEGGIYKISRGTAINEALLDKYLNRTGVRKDDLPAIEEWSEQFKEWLLASQYRGTVEDLYNRKFRGFMHREYSDEPIGIPGLANHDKIKSYQWPGLRWALAAGRGIIAADVGLGKAQPLDAKILTPSGWKFMDDMRVGDEVIAGDGTVTVVTGVFPQGEKEIFKVIMSDGASTECCDEHLWLTQTTKERNNQRRELIESGLPKVRELSEIRKSLRYLDREKNHTIPMVGSVDFTAREVLIDPYLLGVLIGDGSLAHSTPVITNPEIGIIDELRAKLPRGYALNECAVLDRCSSYRLCKAGTDKLHRNGFTAAIAEYGLNKTSSGKFVPDDYKFNVREVRLAVLNGLMDTDGYVDQKGVTVQFTSVSERLADDVKFIVNSLGGNATIKSKIPAFTYKGEKRQGQRAYTVHLRLPPSVAPFLA